VERPDLSPRRHLEDLAAFVSASPSPFHAVAEASRRLTDAGYSCVDESESWPRSPGDFFLQRGGALVAWSTAGARNPSAGFRLIGAHTDSPNLRLRPRPDHESAGMAQLGVEIYGGALLNSWLDRDLGLSGRVSVRTSDDDVSTVLFRCDEPLLRVPQLAIHLDRSIATDGLRLDPQRHLQPVWSSAPQTVPTFRAWLSDRLDVDVDALVSWDLMTHDLTAPALLGVDESLFASARLDNLLSCHAGLTALLNSSSESSKVPVLCLFDHEEVGSQSSSGAASQLLPAVLERIALAADCTRDDWFAALAASLCISADGAHATHPNWPERHEPDHPVRLDGGPVLKWNADARYGTDSPGAAHVLSLARATNIPMQTFVSRNDMPCGSTIGPVTAARLGITTVDVGVAQLSMHSARELAGVIDPARFATLLECFLSTSKSAN
jgi:aspartyl aminopeptidase